MNFTIVELQRIKLEPGEVLTVKLYGDDYDPEDVDSLQNQFKSLFPNNKIMIFVLPNGKDLQLEAVQGTLENKENNEIAKEAIEASLEILAQTQNMVEELNKKDT